MSVGTVIRIALGAVMLVAGIGKLANRTWPEQARVLGAPRRLVPLVAPLELGLGAALVAGLAPGAIGAATAAMLGAFTVVLVARLREGVHPPCACFGGRRPRPIDRWSVVRNLALIAAAVGVAVAGA